MMLPLWAQAAGWGLLSGSALLLGAFVGYAAPLPQRLIAAVMAFGAGVLISALAFELMDKAVERGGFGATAAGFLGIALISGLAATLGYLLFRHFPDSVIAATTAVAAGAILTMLVDTMIPEAFEQSHAFAGLITVVGFLCAFALSKLGG